jgi:tRNA-2-methylthio-N6-dimethylallyladenosine synthase
MSLVLPAKSYWIETYGCQMNVSESAALENDLFFRGWSAAAKPEDAALVILHTCSVRQTAENRIWGRIGFFKHLKETHPHYLVIMGCMAERLQDSIKKEAPNVDLVVGVNGRSLLAGFLEETQRKEMREEFLSEETFSFSQSYGREGTYTSMVPIMHGCNNFCSYCIVPYVRGREVSRSVGEILAEIGDLERKGVKEITLLGQNVNSYSFEGLDFASLLERILRETSDIRWFRFVSSHPKDLSPALIRVIAENERICRHIHLPVQNGSDAVLSRMNRKYTAAQYRRLVSGLKEAVPEVSLTTDILVGFPGETEEDVELTLSLMEEIRFDDAFMYQYNKREGTAASSFPDEVPYKTKIERLSRVIATQKRIAKEIQRDRLGKTVTVLAEGVSKRDKSELLGHTERNEMVVFPGKEDSIGRFFSVRLSALKGRTFKGEVISCHGS